MTTSPNSLPLPASPLPPDLSDRERCVIALFQQAQKSLVSLPDSSAQFFAPFLEKLSAISAIERAEHASLLEAIRSYQAECQRLQLAVQILNSRLAALEKKLAASAQSGAQLTAALEAEQSQRARLVSDIQHLNAHVLSLQSQLLELNGFAPQ